MHHVFVIFLADYSEMYVMRSWNQSSVIWKYEWLLLASIKWPSFEGVNVELDIFQMGEDSWSPTWTFRDVHLRRMEIESENKIDKSIESILILSLQMFILTEGFLCWLPGSQDCSVNPNPFADKRFLSSRVGFMCCNCWTIMRSLGHCLCSPFWS